MGWLKYCLKNKKNEDIKSTTLYQAMACKSRLYPDLNDISYQVNRNPKSFQGLWQLFSLGEIGFIFYWFSRTENEDSM